MAPTHFFHQFPILSTPRLTLREIRRSDANEIYAMRSNGRVNQFIPRGDMQDPELALHLVERTNLAYEQQKSIAWAGILRDQDAIIGTCGFNRIDSENHRAEIGGELGVNYWGKNIAVEAVSAIISFGFEKMKLHSIEAKVSPDNRGAIVLLRKLGFREEACFRESIYYEGTYADMAIYGLLQPEFRSFPKLVE